MPSSFALGPALMITIYLNHPRRSAANFSRALFPEIVHFALRRQMLGMTLPIQLTPKFF